MPRDNRDEMHKIRCDSCGRWFDTAEELAIHKPDCEGAARSGKIAGKPQVSGEKDEGEDREWVGVP